MRSVKVDGNKKSRLQLALSRMVPEGKAEIGVLGTRAGCIVQPSWDLTEYTMMLAALGQCCGKKKLTSCRLT